MISGGGIIFGIKDLPNRSMNYHVIKCDPVVEADVCIIGSGAAGAVLARELIESEKHPDLKLKVVLLEKGGYYEGNDMNQRETDMIPLLYRSGGAIFDDSFRIAISQGCCIGGSTIINDAVCFDPPSRIRREWKDNHDVNFHIEREWDKHIKRVRDMLNVKEVQEGELNRNNKKLRKGASELYLEYGNKWYFKNHGVNERNCVNCMQCGFCHLGCHYETKQDVFRTYIRKALSKPDSRLRIYCNCAVHTIVHKNGIVEGVEGDFLDSEGKSVHRIRVNAKVFIISAGAISSSKLLLRNGIAQKTAGKGLCLHPSVYVIGDFPEEIKGNQGIPMAYTIGDFGVTRTQDDTRRLWGIDLKRDHYEFLIESAFAPILQFALALPGDLSAFKDLMTHFNNFAMAGIMVQDHWNEDNRVALTPTGRASVTYNLGADEVNAIAKGIEIVAEMWFKLGANRIITSYKKMMVIDNELDIPKLCEEIRKHPENLILTSSHPQSGNKIGGNPDDSVVDWNCKVYGFDNLFVCDASVFPTSVGVNPQITVMTVASIIAFRILDYWKERYDASPVRQSDGKTCQVSQPMYCLRDNLSGMFESLKNPVGSRTTFDQILACKEHWSFDPDTMMIENYRQWKGFLPRDDDVAGRILSYFGGFWKRFVNTGKVVDGYVHPTGLGDDHVYATYEAKEVHLGDEKVILLEYDDPPFNYFRDVLKIVDDNTMIGGTFLRDDIKVTSGNQIEMLDKEEVAFAMARRYPFQFMMREDHQEIFNSNKSKIPSLQRMLGVWEGQIVLDSEWTSPCFRFRFYDYKNANGNQSLKCNYLLGSILSGTVLVEQKNDYVLMKDYAKNFVHKIKWINDEFLIGKDYSRSIYTWLVAIWLSQAVVDQGVCGKGNETYIPYVLRKVGEDSAFRFGDVFGAL